MSMRPVFMLGLAILLLLFADIVLFAEIQERRGHYIAKQHDALEAAKVLGLSDLAVSTEARYTRHPAVSDPVVPFMDHPGAAEHFPSGSFFQPVR